MQNASPILDADGKPFLKKFGTARPVHVVGSYDSAAYDPDLEKHWAHATDQAADAAASPEARRQIRIRARYELLENSSYGKGIVRTLVDDTIGRGPRLQMGLANERQNDVVETEWNYWVKAVGLCGKLHQMKTAKTVDGEALALLVTNDRVPHDVKLDVQPIECDRLTSPQLKYDTPTYVDGVTLDSQGYPIGYDILDRHPGANHYQGNPLDFTPYTRQDVLHIFRKDRPEQHRGVSEMQTALPLFAIFRRFVLATVTAAESAANHAMVLSLNDGSFGYEDVDGVDPFDQIQIKRNMATVIPNGDLHQVRAEHPASTFDMFKREILNEIARPVCMPYNIASANSAGYNYASGRLDHQVYDRAIKTEQRIWEEEIVDRIFAAWLIEASLFGLLPARVAEPVLGAARRFGAEGVAARLPHVWQWDRRPHVDPSKEATAQGARLRNGTTSREHELFEVGLNITEVDNAAAASYGMDVDTYRRTLAMATFANGNPIGEQPEDEEADDPNAPVDDGDEADDETSQGDEAEATPAGDADGRE